MIYEPEWKELKSKTVKQGLCKQCGKKSSWHPRHWLFRHVAVRGQGIHGPKVMTERLCPTCAALLKAPEEKSYDITSWHIS